MKHLSLQLARQQVALDLTPLPSERVPITGAAGRILAEPVIADRDQPAFNRSAMDGYAVQAADTVAPPVMLKVVGVIAAGTNWPGTLKPGEAVKIMTGAPVPAGADAVQMVENTHGGDSSVSILKSVTVGQHIAPQGQDIRAGEAALVAGAVLTSSRLSLAWSFGAAEVTVYRRPRVAILTTGDELVELDETPGPNQIRDSNRCALSDIVRRAGGEVVRAQIVRDDVAATREAIRAGLESDVLVLSGGVSAGDYDYVAQCLEDEGVTQVFHKVHMKPGKPIWYGRAGTLPVFGLPGNPVSSQVTARLFLVPVLRRLAGYQRIYDPTLQLPLAEAFRGTGDRPTFQPAVIEWDSGSVRLLKTHGSGDQRHFAGGAALVELPPDRSGFAQGELVTVHLDPEALL